MKNILDKIHPKYYTALFALGTAGFIFVVNFYLLFPQSEKIEQLRINAQMEKQKVKVVEAFALEHPNTELYLFQLDEQKAQVDRLMPDKSDISDFLAQLDQAAKSTGLKIMNIKISPIVNKNGYRDIPIEIVVKGDYFQTINFLTKMENLSRFNTINSIVTQSREKDLETKLAVTVYSYGIVQNQKPAEPAKK